MYQELKNFLLQLIVLLGEKLKWRNGPPPDPEIQSAAGQGPPNLEGGRNPTDLDDGNRLFDAAKWPFLVLGLYFGGAGAAMQALQATGPLPISSQLVCIALVLSLVSFLCCIHTFPDYQLASIVFIYVGIFFGATALVVALVRNLHPALMGAMVAIYVSAIVAFIFVHVSKLVRYIHI